MTARDLPGAHPSRPPQAPPRSGGSGRRTRLRAGSAVLAALFLLALAAMVGGRGWIEARVARRVTAELESRLPGRARIDGVRLAGWNRVDVSGFAWEPGRGPLERVDVDVLSVRASPYAWLRGERRLAALEVVGGRVLLAPGGVSDEAEPAAEGDPAAPAGASDAAVARLRALVDRTRTRVPASVSRARGALDTVLLAGAPADFREVSVEGLPWGVGLSHLEGRIAGGVGRGVSAQVAGNLSIGGQFRLAADLEPGRIPQARLDVEDLQIADLAGGDAHISDSAHVEGGVVSGALAIEEAPSGDGPLLTLQVRLEEAVLWADALGDRPWRLSLSQDLLLQPTGGGIEFRKWAWTLGGVSGRVEADLEALDSDPTFRIVVVPEDMDLGDLVAALPDGTLPEEWGLRLAGPLPLTAWVEGPLSDRARWTFDWKADWSKVRVVSDPARDPVLRVTRPFDFVFQRAYHDPVLRHLAPGNPHYAALDEVSHAGRMAVVAAEDAAFFGHSGFDAEGIQAAVLENLQEGGEGRGGSTITQQLAKNLFLSGDRTVIRKLREAVLAARMEEALSKQRILELYLAVAEWGHEVYGIRDAARHYFGKEPGELRSREAAYLALMLPSPRRYHDYYHAVGKVTEHLQASVDGMVRRMHRLGFIDEETYVREMTWGLTFAGCDRSGQTPFDEPRPKGPPAEDLVPAGMEGEDPLTFWDLEPMEEPGMPPAPREGAPAPP